MDFKTLEIKKIESIKSIVSKVTGVYDFNKRHRTRSGPIFARQLVHYFLSIHTRLTLREIGEMFSGHHYSTVLHSIRAIDNYEFSKYPEWEYDCIQKVSYLINRELYSSNVKANGTEQAA